MVHAHWAESREPRLAVCQVTETPSAEVLRDRETPGAGGGRERAATVTAVAPVRSNLCPHPHPPKQEER